jgi:putative hydrolase of the HAD superfamily
MTMSKGTPVRTRAVIFDYYGTLTVSASASARRAGVNRVAGVLGVPGDVLFEAISTTFTQRASGRCGDMLATMAWLADRCGHRASPAQLSAACSVRTEIERGYASALRDDTVDTLRWVRAQGLGVGVVSDCTHELPDFWTDIPVAPLVDATVFSVLIGHRKPHASLYRSACQQLGIVASEAIYVGDGGSNELTGATAAGMAAVRLVAEDGTDALVYDVEQNWNGPVIHSLTALTSGALSAFGDDDADDP